MTGASIWPSSKALSSGLLDESDLADAASAIEPGSSAGILIFENRWATDFVAGAASRRCAAGRGRIHPPGHARRVTRRDGRLIDSRKDQTMPGLLRGVARTAVVAGPPPRFRTASPVARPIAGHSRKSSSTRQQQYAATAAGAGCACARRRRHRHAVEGARRAEGAGDPHRRRVRRAKGEVLAM